MKRLMAIVLTYNEAEHIGACLATLRFADRVLVFDSFSDDATVDIAREGGAEVIQRAFKDYADQRNAALDVASGRCEWALFIDADERVSPALAAEILEVIEQDDVAGWRMPRHNYIFGVLTLGGGWHPDYQTRLLRVGHARYDAARPVHETVLLDGELGALTQPIIHHNYRDVAHFVQKQRRYAQLDAAMLYAAGDRPKRRSLLTMPLRHFYWRFVTLKGYRDGWHGLRLCLLMARYEYQKRSLLSRLRSRESRADQAPTSKP